MLVNRKNPGRDLQEDAADGARGLADRVSRRDARVDGSVANFKGGIFLLAIETGLPVVPMTLDGSRQVMPKGRLMTLSRRRHVTIHPPIPTNPGLTRDDARALASAVRRGHRRRDGH